MRSGNFGRRVVEAGGAAGGAPLEEAAALEGGSQVTHCGARIRGRHSVDTKLTAPASTTRTSRFDQRRSGPAGNLVDHLAETWGETGASAAAAHGATAVEAGETALATEAPGGPNDALAAANHSSSGIARLIIKTHPAARTTGNQGKFLFKMMRIAGSSLPSHPRSESIRRARLFISIAVSSFEPVVTQPGVRSPFIGAARGLPRRVGAPALDTHSAAETPASDRSCCLRAHPSAPV